MNILEYFLIVNDLSVVFPDLLALTSFENTVILLLTNLCVWVFIFIIISIIFKIVVRLK